MVPCFVAVSQASLRSEDRIRSIFYLFNIARACVILRGIIYFFFLSFSILYFLFLFLFLFFILLLSIKTYSFSIIKNDDKKITNLLYYYIKYLTNNSFFRICSTRCEKCSLLRPISLRSWANTHLCRSPLWHSTTITTAVSRFMRSH